MVSEHDSKMALNKQREEEQLWYKLTGRIHIRYFDKDDFTSENIEKLLTCDDIRIRSDLAKDERLQPTYEQTIRGLHDESFVVQEAWAGRPGINIPSEEVDKLLDNNSELVRIATVSNPSIHLNLQQIDKCAIDPNPNVRAALWSREDMNIAPNQRDFLLQDCAPEVRAALAKTLKSATPEQIEQLVTDPDYRVRESLLMNPNLELTHDQYKRLAKDEQKDIAVRAIERCKSWTMKEAHEALKNPLISSLESYAWREVKKQLEQNMAPVTKGFGKIKKAIEEIGSIPNDIFEGMRL